MFDADSILIEVETAYLEQQSDPNKQQFVFSYTITIRNESSVEVTLLSRHWVITDAMSRVQEVMGDGVVGVQPNIAPGEQFQYTSGAVLDTGVGTMEGKYEMVTEQGEAFNARIPKFTLSIPRVLH